VGARRRAAGFRSVGLGAALDGSRPGALRHETASALAQRDFPHALFLLKSLRELPGHERTAETQDAWARLYRTCARTGLRSAWIVRELGISRVVVPEGVLEVEVSRDGQWLLTVEHVDCDQQTVRVRYVDWELTAEEDADFDERARPRLDEFLSRQAPPGDPPRPPTDGFDDLLFTLACAGHGHLRPEGVRRALLGPA
jgi:hypothetical protein